MDYAVIQEYGSQGGYPIEPKNKKALFWVGLDHPVARVKNHPGVKPKFFLRDPLLEQAEVFLQELGTKVGFDK